LDQSIFQAYCAPRDIGKTETILNTYKELLSEYPPRELEDQGRIRDDMLRKIGEAGLFGISIPESYGGVGIGLWDQLKIVEGVASLDMSATLVFLAHLLIGIKGIKIFGTELQKQKYLEPTASGDMIFSYALTEPKIGSDARHIETKAELSGGGTSYVLSGVKVSRDMPKMGLKNSSTAMTHFDSVRVPAENCPGD